MIISACRPREFSEEKAASSLFFKIYEPFAGLALQANIKTWPSRERFLLDK